MTEEQMKEVEALYEENAKMREALAAIIQASQLVSMRLNTYSKRGAGMLSGVQACAKIAEQALGESNGR